MFLTISLCIVFINFDIGSYFLVYFCSLSNLIVVKN